MVIVRWGGRAAGGRRRLTPRTTTHPQPPFPRAPHTHTHTHDSLQHRQSAQRARDLILETHDEFSDDLGVLDGLDVRTAVRGGETPLQTCALAWLAQRPEISNVLVGLTNESYVDDAIDAASAS